MLFLIKNQRVLNKVLVITLLVLFSLFLLPSVVFSQGIVTCVDIDDCGYDDLLSTFQSILNFIIYAAGVVAVIMFVWAGFIYITAGGDPGKISEAHGIFKNTLIGFIFVLAAWLIISTILAIFGVSGTPLGEIG